MAAVAVRIPAAIAQTAPTLNVLDRSPACISTAFKRISSSRRRCLDELFPDESNERIMPPNPQPDFFDDTFKIWQDKVLTCDDTEQVLVLELKNCNRHNPRPSASRSHPAISQ